ncbi:hypothetical protein ACFUTX_09330 [Microbacterium sp. NPDC057407]|uniref:hypothetical protein n=1 Tax=Microbacterium sp. NPDC057407 TaxID=3346120 RepID=UPI00366E2D73
MTAGTVVAVTRKRHGLGNRLRVTLGSRSLARWAQRDFAYVWPTGDTFGATFDELWQFGEKRISTLRSRLLSARHPYRSHDLTWLAAGRDDRVWQVRTAHALHLPPGATAWGEELQSLTPVPSIAGRVESFYSQHLEGGPYVGVMVRAHAVSNTETLRHSPVSWYIERMKQVSDEHPGIRFFLSADTAEAQEQVFDAVPGTVALSDKGGYNTKAALISSVVDLYLLASSTHLLAPHYSSFPEIAQQLAGPTLRLETSMTDASTRFGVDDHPVVVSDPLRPSVRVPV